MYTIPKTVAEKIEDLTVSVYWDRSNELNSKQISQLISGECDIDEIVWDMISCSGYECDMNKTAIMNHLEAAYHDGEIESDSSAGRFYSDVLWDDYNDQWGGCYYPMIDYNAGQLVRNSSAYIGLSLDMNHDHGLGYFLGIEDYLDELEALNIDPASMTEHLDFNGEVPSHPERRGHEAVPPETLAEMWENCFYPGSYTVMLTGTDLAQLLEDIPEAEKRGITIEKGTRIIIHDYLNGASSTSGELGRDWFIPADMISKFYNDSACKYGIQACCGFCSYVWDGGWTVPEVVETEEAEAVVA